MDRGTGVVARRSGLRRHTLPDLVEGFSCTHLEVDIDEAGDIGDAGVDLNGRDSISSSQHDGFGDVGEIRTGSDADDEVVVNVLLGVEFRDGVLGKHLFEQHNIGSHHLPALAERRNFDRRIVLNGIDKVASGAHKSMHVAMNFNDVLGTGEGVKAVDVLSEDPEVIEVFFHLGQHLMPAIEFGLSCTSLDLSHVFPGDFRLGSEDGATERFLDRNPVFGILVVVESANSSVNGKPRVGRDPGACDYEHFLGIGKQIGNLFELGLNGVIVFSGHGRVLLAVGRGAVQYGLETSRRIDGNGFSTRRPAGFPGTVA